MGSKSITKFRNDTRTLLKIAKQPGATEASGVLSNPKYGNGLITVDITGCSGTKAVITGIRPSVRVVDACFLPSAIGNANNTIYVYDGTSAASRLICKFVAATIQNKATASYYVLASAAMRFRTASMVLVGTGTAASTGVKGILTLHVQPI